MLCYLFEALWQLLLSLFVLYLRFRPDFVGFMCPVFEDLSQTLLDLFLRSCSPSLSLYFNILRQSIQFQGNQAQKPSGF